MKCIYMQKLTLCCRYLKNLQNLNKSWLEQPASFCSSSLHLSGRVELAVSRDTGESNGHAANGLVARHGSKPSRPAAEDVCKILLVCSIVDELLHLPLHSDCPRK